MRDYISICFFAANGIKCCNILKKRIENPKKTKAGLKYIPPDSPQI